MDEVEACLASLVISDEKQGFGENELIEIDNVYVINYSFMKAGNVMDAEKEEKLSLPVIQSLIEKEKKDYEPCRRKGVSQPVSIKPFEPRRQISISQPLLKDDTPVYNSEVEEGETKKDDLMKEEALRELKMEMDTLNRTVNEILNPKWHSLFIMLNACGVLDERDIKAFLFDYLATMVK